MKLCKKEQLSLKVKKAQINTDFAGYFSILNLYFRNSVYLQNIKQEMHKITFQQ